MVVSKLKNPINRLSASEIKDLLKEEFMEQLTRPLTDVELYFINWMADAIEKERN